MMFVCILSHVSYSNTCEYCGTYNNDNNNNFNNFNNCNNNNTALVSIDGIVT